MRNHQINLLIQIKTTNVGVLGFWGSLLANLKSLDPEATNNIVNSSEPLETVSSVTDVPTTIGYSKVPPNSSVDSRAVDDY